MLRCELGGLFAVDARSDLDGRAAVVRGTVLFDYFFLLQVTGPERKSPFPGAFPEKAVKESDTSQLVGLEKRGDSRAWGLLILMTRILNDQANIVPRGKGNSGSNVVGIVDIDGIASIVAQLAW